MLKRLLIVLLLVLGMLGCKSIQPDDLVGTWVMTNASRQVLPADLQQAPAKIVVGPDGTFVMSEIPGLFFFPGRRTARLESGSGVWKLISHEGKQQMQCNFRVIADWKETDLPYGTQLEVSRSFSTVSLYYFFGDADEGRRVQFEKK